MNLVICPSPKPADSSCSTSSAGSTNAPPSSSPRTSPSVNGPACSATPKRRPPCSTASHITATSSRPATTPGASKAAMMIKQPALAPSPQSRPAPTVRALPPELAVQRGPFWMPIRGPNPTPIDTVDDATGQLILEWGSKPWAGLKGLETRFKTDAEAPLFAQTHVDFNHPPSEA